MEAKEKKYIITRFAVAINNIIKKNKEIAEKNKLKGIKDVKLITSLRKLEASSGISYPIIQRISIAEKNPALTTIAAIAEGFGISEVDLFANFCNVTDQEIKSYLTSLKKTKSTPKKKKV